MARFRASRKPQSNEFHLPLSRPANAAHGGHARVSPQCENLASRYKRPCEASEAGAEQGPRGVQREAGCAPGPSIRWGGAGRACKAAFLTRVKQVIFT